MKQICCYGGILTQVSDKHFGYLCGFKWHLDKAGYVQGKINKKQVYMHHIIVLDLLKLIIPEGCNIDHWDQIKVNNQDENLRIITKSRNSHNRGANKNNQLGVKGIRWHGQSKKYTAQIVINGERIHLGYFDTLGEAQEARIAAEIYYGVTNDS